jgi:hypothetical protein
VCFNPRLPSAGLDNDKCSIGVPIHPPYVPRVREPNSEATTRYSRNLTSEHASEANGLQDKADVAIATQVPRLRTPLMGVLRF